MLGFRYSFLGNDISIMLNIDLAVQDTLQLEVAGEFELAEVGLQGDRSRGDRHDGNVSFA